MSLSCSPKESARMLSSNLQRQENVSNVKPSRKQYYSFMLHQFHMLSPAILFPCLSYFVGKQSTFYIMKIRTTTRDIPYLNRGMRWTARIYPDWQEVTTDVASQILCIGYQESFMESFMSFKRCPYP